MRTKLLTPLEEAEAIMHCSECDSENLTQEENCYNSSYRITVSCDECGWTVEFDGRTPAPF